MRWLLRRAPNGPVHRAVQEGGGTMVLMMTACGLNVRWDKPHAPWERAPFTGSDADFRAEVTCKKCAS